IPFPFAMGADAWALRSLLGALGRRASLIELWSLRVGIEAVMNTMPVGALWADTLAPVLVTRRTGVPLTDAIAATPAKRWTVIRTHGTFVALAGAAGVGLITRASRAMFGSDVLLVVVFGGALTLLILSFAIEGIAAHGQVGGRVSNVLAGARFAAIDRFIADK